MIRKSRFDNSIMCYEAGDDAPQRLRDTLRDRGLGFALFGEDVATPMIVIDAAAGLSDEQMIAVEAHEVGHILTGSEEEETADLFAIALLAACFNSYQFLVNCCYKFFARAAARLHVFVGVSDDLSLV